MNQTDQHGFGRTSVVTRNTFLEGGTRHMTGHIHQEGYWSVQQKWNR